MTDTQKKQLIGAFATVIIMAVFAAVIIGYAWAHKAMLAGH